MSPVQSSAHESARHATVPCIFCDTLNRVDLSKVAHQPKCGSCGKPILLDRPVKVHDGNVQAVLEGTDVPVLIDFYADWCAPCKMMAPVLDEIAGEDVGHLLVVKLNTDANPQSARRWNVRSLPTFMVVRGGEPAGQVVGAVPKARLADLIGPVVAA